MMTTDENQLNELKISLETIRQINWLDDIDKLPNDVDKILLDQCSDLIEEFINNNESLPKDIIKSKPKVQKRKILKTKKRKIKVKNKINKIKQSKSKTIKTQSFNSTNNYPCYPSSFPCFRSCGPINCPKNKLPMPRDLWYRIVYSQILEQQLDYQGSGEANTSQASKRKYKENNKSNINNPRQQQTMNAAISSTKIIKLDVDDQMNKPELNEENLQSVLSNSYKPFSLDNLEYIAETLPLEIESKRNQSKDLINSEIKFKDNLKILSSQSADAELVHRSKIYRGISADATLQQNISIPTSIILTNQSNLEESLNSLLASSLQPKKSNLSIPPLTNKTTDDNPPTNSSVIFEHPLINQLYEYYNLEDIPRFQLFKRLNRRLKHIHETLKTMSSNDIELKLKYKRDALVKKRQIPVSSLTKDERLAMIELELNVYEYIQALDELSSKSFNINNNDELETSPILPSYGSGIESAIISDSSVTQFSERPEQLTSWTGSNIMNMFENLTPLHKSQIHQQLIRRYEHIHKKAQKLNNTQLQAQIDSKSKALEQNKKILQPTTDELLRIAELELCLYELRTEQTQRNNFN